MIKEIVMSLGKEIVLRPRFKRTISQSSTVILDRLEATKETQVDFVVSRVDNHVFIRIPKNKQHFWSPQLHVEVDEIDEQQCELRGLFGPNPTVWTFFMFLHFLVACLFIGFGIWAYTNVTLKASYGIQLGLLFFMMLVWFALYFAGRMGKATGKSEMIALHDFLNRIVGV